MTGLNANDPVVVSDGVLHSIVIGETAGDDDGINCNTDEWICCDIQTTFDRCHLNHI